MRAQTSWTRAISRPARSPDTSFAPLKREAECNIHARIHRVAQVIHAVNVDHINVLRVEPVAGPRPDESERIAAVLEAVIPVVALADTKRVCLSKVGLITVVRNAVATGMLRLCSRLGLGPGFRFSFLLCVLRLRLCVLLFLRVFLRRLCRFFWLSLDRKSVV